jgi:hypothetical protein
VRASLWLARRKQIVAPSVSVSRGANGGGGDGEQQHIAVEARLALRCINLAPKAASKRANEQTSEQTTNGRIRTAKPTQMNLKIGDRRHRIAIR